LGLAAGATQFAEADLPAGAAASETRWGMMVDADKCAEGCTACVSACNDEHGLSPTLGATTDAQWIRKLTVRDKQTGYISRFPVMCQHCEFPPCVDVCPTGASFRRPDGIVLVDKHTCIGCRYCVIACPYDARAFVHEPISNQLPHAPRGRGTVEGCTFCVHRLDADRSNSPACVEACADAGHGALIFGDLNDPDSAVARAMGTESSQALRADLRTNPGVRYRNV